MSRVIESRAKEYLFNIFKNDKYRFFEKLPTETGFDIWMENIYTRKKYRIELKATEGEFSKNSDIFQKLYFSAENEVKNFEAGKTKILRIFLGDNPPKIFIFDNNVLSLGARFEEEYRAKIMGPKNYDSIFEVKSQN